MVNTNIVTILIAVSSLISSGQPHPHLPSLPKVFPLPKTLPAFLAPS